MTSDDRTAYARELGSEERERLGVSARFDRPLFRGPPRTPEQARRRATTRENKILLRGRFAADGREVWDVVKVANGEHTLYARGLLYVEEAAELAVQCMSGRIFVSLAGARALLVAGQNGVATPVRSVNPLGPRVTFVPRDGKGLSESRLIEVRPGAPPKPKILTAGR